MEMSKRSFGIEIEFNGSDGDRKSIKNTLNMILDSDVVCTVDDYSSTKWFLTTDSSCGLELVSPILQGEDGLDSVRRIVQAMKASGLRVDSRCGLHVHINARDLSKTQLVHIYQQYARWETIIDQFVDDSRRHNHYCASVNQGGNYAKCTFRNLMSNGRYYKLNITAFIKHGTVEFRHHEGTLNSDSIINWIVFCGAFVERVITHKSAVRVSANNTFNSFKNWMRATLNDDVYCMNMISYLCATYIANSGKTVYDSALP